MFGVGRPLNACFDDVAVFLERIAVRTEDGTHTYEPCRDVGSRACRVVGAIRPNDGELVAATLTAEKGLHLLRYRGSELVEKVHVLSGDELRSECDAGFSIVTEYRAVFSRDASKVVFACNYSIPMKLCALRLTLKGSRVVNRELLMHADASAVAGADPVCFSGRQAYAIVKLEPTESSSDAVKVSLVEVSAERGVAVEEAVVRSELLANALAKSASLGGMLVQASESCSEPLSLFALAALVPERGPYWTERAVALTLDLASDGLRVRSAALIESVLDDVSQVSVTGGVPFTAGRAVLGLTAVLESGFIASLSASITNQGALVGVELEEDNEEVAVQGACVAKKLTF